VYESRDGTVCAGTLSGGVSELRNGHFTNHTTANGLSSNTVSAIAEGADGTMWFGTPDGANSFSQGHWNTYRTTEGLPSDDVNCLFEDSTGVLWTGTSKGLAFFKTGYVQLPRGLPASLREPTLGIAKADGFGLQPRITCCVFNGIR